MNIAYADPPYLGSAARHYAKHHPDAAAYDELDAHRALITRLQGFDGWALSMASVNLRDLLPLCPPGTRVAAWCKTFVPFKPSVRTAYAWEPVVFAAARPRPHTVDTMRDWLACPVPLQRGLPGVKPHEFAFWLFDLLGLDPADEFVDLFPGSGAVAAAHMAWLGRPRDVPLFDGIAR